MTRDEFLMVREDLLNDDWVPMAHVLASTWRYMEQVPKTHIQILDVDGNWVKPQAISFHIGRAYRVDPTWAGPADPTAKPKPAFVDNEPYIDDMGGLVVKDLNNQAWLVPRLTVGDHGCIGFIYDGQPMLVPQYKTIYDSPAKTRRIGYELVVPDAVRFRK